MIECKPCNGTGRFQGIFGGPGWPSCPHCSGSGYNYDIMVPHPEARPIGKVYSEEALEQLLANASRTAAEAMRERAAKLCYDDETSLMEYPSEEAKAHYEAGAADAADSIAAAIRSLEIEGGAK